MFPNKKFRMSKGEVVKAGSRSHRGATLTEIIIYMLIFTIITGVVVTVYIFFGRSFRKSTSAFDVQSETQTALQWMKSDLLQTSLGTITTYPNEEHPDEMPGISFISAVEPLDKVTDGTADFLISNYGTPAWCKYVFYTLIPNPDPGDNFTPKTARLVRWEKEILGYQAMPVTTDILPSAHAANGGKPRTILTSVMRPGKPAMKGFDHLYMKSGNFEPNLAGSSKIALGSKGPLRPSGVSSGSTAWDCGGFRTAFVRKVSDSEYLNCQNPSQESDGGSSSSRRFGSLAATKAGRIKPKDPGKGSSLATSTTTEMVQVDLIVLVISKSSGKPSAFSLTFQMNPRN